jgi:RimJ/RimL family protein N-acetyltransferase
MLRILASCWKSSPRVRRGRSRACTARPSKHALWSHPDVRRYLFDDQEVTREKAAEVLADALAVADRGLGLWMIELRADDWQIGCIGLLPTTIAKYEPRVAGLVEPVVAIDPEHWHRGYAVDALRAVIDYAFDTLALTRIAGATDVPNVASRRMLERAGYQLLSERDGPVYRLLTYTMTPADRVEGEPGEPATPKDDT